MKNVYEVLRRDVQDFLNNLDLLEGYEKGKRDYRQFATYAKANLAALNAHFGEMIADVEPLDIDAVKSDYWRKHWAIDMEIFCYNMSEDEVDTYTKRMEAALLANGNVGVCCWDFENDEPRIGIWGDDGGDKETLDKLLAELHAKGCGFEYPERDDL